MGASEQLHAPVALFPGKDTAAPIARGDPYLRKYVQITF
jgi:hypothetical protein